ncbi:MAG: DEAD/DEAH box helicase [Actinomycetota bacterium]|nr:DEAD/DEAH box helicase [Actinomycetota bacterium]
MIDEREIRRAVDEGSYSRGRAYASQRRVREIDWDADEGVLTGTIAGSGRAPYVAEVFVSHEPGRGNFVEESYCSCPVGGDCKHVVALLLTARSAHQAAPVPAAQKAWRRAMDAALHTEEPPGSILERAVQFELIASKPTRYDTRSTLPFRVGMRPVTMGKSGKWVRSEVSWRNLAYASATKRFNPRHHQVLTSLQSLHSASTRHTYYYGQGDQWIYLDQLRGSQLWNIFAEAQAAGLPFVHSRKDGPPVELAEPVEAVLDLNRTKDGIQLQPSIYAGETRLDPVSHGLTGGSEPSGAYWWSVADEGAPSLKNCTITLAPFSAPATEAFASLLTADEPIHVPEAESSEFLLSYYPRLVARMPVESRDGSVQLPSPPRPRLHLQIQNSGQHRLALRWRWEYRPEEALANDSGVFLPLWPQPGEQSYRDTPEEKRILAALDPIVGSTGPLFDSRSPLARLNAKAELSGMQAAAFATDVLPLIRDMPDLAIEIAEDMADYRRSAENPIVSLSTTSNHESRDWFDLSVTVTVEGEDVPFDQLFLALATGQDSLLLPSGLHFSLDNPELHRLRTLIEEARALQDSPAGPLRLSRFQAGLWSELEELGVVTAQAAEWRQAVDDLRGLDDDAPAPLPATVHAELRPYQLTGYTWLSRLYDGGLGGVLADDMGLGKTLQVLALIARVRERDDAAPPFLVVAPTSVASNWAAEARRFVPHLRVNSIDQTKARRGEKLDEIAGHCEIVATSYTLFRLEYDDYDALNWSGLILDEAQFVKNHQSKTYQCAKRLDARIKLAVTGTPMENNLMELWALLGLVAPGLFPSPKRFTDYYRTPIEREGNQERLGQLHKRIRPLMLRRNKDQVAVDLPAKQEQVIEVDLSPKHRAVYDRHLNRERQKVLGLMDDFDGNRFAIFRSLMLLRRLSLDPSLVDETYAGVPATKLDVLFDLLDEATAEGHRVLVFSQFTGFLGRVRDRLDKHGSDYCYLDGKTRKRAEVIERFRTGAAPVFLISLKAGGFGLNLTEADYCILLDPWWNPATEAQAVDRVHRIGQQRNVMVYRLVAKNTIEEKVMALKAGKAKLFDSVIGDAELAGGHLSQADIRGLLE